LQNFHDASDRRRCEFAAADEDGYQAEFLFAEAEFAEDGIENVLRTDVAGDQAERACRAARGKNVAAPAPENARMLCH
jgi:hypothetical protein